MEWEVNSNIRKIGKWPIDPTKRNVSAGSKPIDYLIVGAGVFGTSAAYHLSQTHPTATVTIIDRTPFPPRHAASTDVNKIVRADYSSAFYMDLAYEAMRAWQTWPELKAVYHRTGWINFSQKGSDLPERIRKNFRERGVDPTSDIAIDEVKTMFGGIFGQTDFSGIQSTYWNPEAGWCDAGAAVAAILESTLRNPRVKYIVADVEKLLLSGDGRRVQGVLVRSGERFLANKTLLATGAWTSRLMTATEDELRLPENDRVENQVKAAGVCVAHFRLSDREMEELKEMPVVIYGDGGDGQPPPKKSHLLKYVNGHSFTHTVTTPSGRKVSAPPDRDQGTVPERLKRETLQVIASKVTPKYTTRSVEYWRMCWDSVSPSQDHLITRHPTLQSLYFAVGGSFHSWKFLPIIGRYIVGVLDGKSNGEEKDLHFAWKTTRFEGRGAHEKAYPTRELEDFYAEAKESSRL